MSRIITIRDENDMDEIRKLCTVDCTYGASYGFDKKTETIENTRKDMKDTKIEAFCILPHTNKVLVPFSTYPREMKKLQFSADLPFNFKFHLRQYQIDDLKVLMPIVESTGACLFQAECGYGKTIIIAYLIAQYKSRAIVLTPNEKCQHQNAFLIEKTITGCTVAKTKPDGSYDNTADILVAVTSHLKGRLGQFDEYEIAIFDEIHLLSKPLSVPGMLSIKPKRLIGFTATPEKKEDLTRLFVGNETVVGSRRKRWSIAFLQVPFEHKAKPMKFTDITTEMASHKPFIDMITKLCVYYFTQRKRVMLLTERNELRDNLATEINDMGLSVSVIGPSTKSSNADVIIGNKGMVGTGFDLSNAIGDQFDGQHPEVIIFCFTLADQSLFIQTSGRSFRAEYPLVIYPEFSGWATSRKHVRQIREWTKDNEYCTHRPVLERFLQYVADGELDPSDPYK